MQSDSPVAGGDRHHQGTTSCPECGGNVVTDPRETVCSDCGLVVADQPIDLGPEWRSFETDRTNPERTGAPLTKARHDRGLSTTIGRFEDGQGNDLSASKRRQLARLRREQKRGTWQSKVDRNLGHGCTEIARIVGALGLARSLREQASTLFRTAQHKDLLRGRSIEAMAAASVYAACRCGEIVRPIERVAAVARVDEGRLRNCYDVLNVELGLATPVQRPTDMVPWVADGCDAPAPVRRRALELAQVAEETGVANGCRPSGVAAACLYRAGDKRGWPVSRAAVAEAANVTPVTVRTHDKALVAALED